MKIYHFKQIYSFKSLIYFEKNYGLLEKTMLLWKKNIEL